MSLLQAHPLHTSWSGHFVDQGRNWDMEFKSFIIDGKKISGRGTDEIGDFELTGKISGSDVSFQKAYSSHSVSYDGKIEETEDGQRIHGEWSIPRARGRVGDFELKRSLELERKRQAAFAMVVARLKMLVGLIRLFFEDIGFASVQLYYLFGLTHTKWGLAQRFTLVSVAAGLFVSAAGPCNEYFTSRRLRALSGEVSEQPPSVHGGELVRKNSSGEYEKVDDKKEQDQDDEEGDHIYRKRLEASSSLSSQNLVAGNWEHVEVLMERPHIPAEIPDVAIIDVLHTRAHVHRALVAAVLLLWVYIVLVPFLFPIGCQKPVPTSAHVGFLLIAVSSLFIQVWCAAHTKYGYLVLVHAPQAFAFNILLSLMGSFDAYSDLIFVLMVHACGIWLWKPAALIYLIGVVMMQAVPGLVMLICKLNIPAALKLTEMNILLMLLKPSVN